MFGEQRPAAPAVLAGLIFRPGFRPSRDAFRELAGQGLFSLSERGKPENAGGGHAGGKDFLELLHDGLAFDVAGLDPGPPVALPRPVHRFGRLEDEVGLEAIALLPGLHIAGGAHMIPVVKAAVSLLHILQVLPGLCAITWCPAANLVDPEWFRASTAKWLSGGPFPAFALVSLVENSEGQVASHGLRFLGGCEFRFDPPGRLNAMAMAIRLLDWLAMQGRIHAPCTVAIPGIGEVVIEPANDGNIIVRGV